jgi:hypothetical protein
LTLIAGAGHAALLEQPDATADALIAFLAAAPAMGKRAQLG